MPSGVAVVLLLIAFTVFYLVVRYIAESIVKKTEDKLHNTRARKQNQEHPSQSVNLADRYQGIDQSRNEQNK